MYKKLFACLICTVLIITQVGCISKEPVSKTDFYLNTTCTIEIREMSKGDAEDLIDDAFAECGRYEGLFSRTIEGSDIYKINHANGEPVTVDPETSSVIAAGLEKCRESDGKFDITVGRLTALWDFSAAEPKVPSEAEIKEVLPTIGCDKVVLHENTAQLTDPDTWLDLGAIAKGYIADRLAEFLTDNGVKSGVVNLGGNIVTIGTKEDGSKWSIGLEAPYSERTEIIGSIKMENQTVVTSGTFERHFEENGKDYHHVLNPATGYPMDTDIVSVSILGDIGTSTQCDGYSTTCLLLGKEKAVEFMKDKEGFEYCITDTDGNITKSEGFDLIEEK